MPNRDGTGYDGSLRNCVPTNEYRTASLSRPRWGRRNRPRRELGYGYGRGRGRGRGRY